MDANAALTRIADGLDDACWRRLQRKVPHQNKTGRTRARRENHQQRIVKAKGYLNLELNYEDVAEFDYKPGKCTRSYKVVALRKNRSKGEQALLDEVRYFFYITTYTDLTAEEIVALANQRCDQENVIGDLKSGIGALHVPLYDLVSNWAYMLIAAFLVRADDALQD
jgi:hypothetical protein